MNKSNLVSISIVVVISVAIAGWILYINDGAHHGHEHGGHSGHHDTHGHGAHEEEFERGPNRGRLLSQDGFSIEITIFEQGVPPEFRIYSYYDNQPLAASEVELEIKLKRVDNTIDIIKFAPHQDYLRGDSEIYEPHSFEVLIEAKHKSKTYNWQYENFEGRTQIQQQMAKEMGIETETVGPASLTDTMILTGRIQANPNRISRVRPRFAGVIKTIHKELGDIVKAGETLATVQSNESLQNYTIKAPIKGLIVKRDIQIGEATSNEPLFIIADLSEVWVELDVFVRDLNRIKSGQSVVVETLDGKEQTTTVIDWVSPLTAHASQSVQARASIKNKHGLFRPGQFIRAQVTVAEYQVPLAVRHSAIQGFRDFKVVFALFGDTYEVRMLELGRQDDNWIEVLSGIKPGTRYVIQNSYLIKADIEKSGASHDH